MNITIFYSWQSDTEFNKKGIRLALRDAMNDLEQQNPNLNLKLDEATSNNVGTLHIPNSILENISNADIFIGDLSIVGQTIDSKKKLANPNVLIELGYAISQLGWNRTLILFNKQFGTFGDLPFDIEKRSCLDFKIIADRDTSGIGMLRTELIARLQAIIDSNPAKPAIRTEPFDKERTHDIQILNNLLLRVPISLMDQFFAYGFNQIDIRVIYGISKWREAFNSKGFYVNDKRIRRHIGNFYGCWNIMLPLLKHYKLSQDKTNYVSTLPDTGRDNDKARDVRWSIQEIEKRYTSLLNFIRKYFSEIETKSV